MVKIKQIITRELSFEPKEKGKLRRKVVYESANRTQIFFRGCEFFVIKDSGRTLDVTFSYVDGLFMVYKEDVRKIK